VATAQFTPIIRFASLPAEVKKEISVSGIPESAWSVAIIPLPPVVVMGPVLNGLGLNPETPVNPASVMKLVTTRAALGLLGPQFRHQTRIATTGRLEAGVLRGDLFFQGGGDPKLVVEDLDEIAKRLKSMGIERIEGNLVVDGTRFDEPEIDPGQFDGRPFSTYNVGPHAAMVNFKSVKVSVWPEAGKRVRVMTEPRFRDQELLQKIQLIDGGCNKNRVSARMEQPTKGAEPKLLVSGVIGKQCNGVDFYVSVMDHARFAMTAFRAAWEATGGVMKVKLQTGITPENARTLVQWESPRPLIELVADINKLSNNPMTRQLFLTLSAGEGRPATRQESRLAVKAYLASRGLVFPELVIDNGSGLSREERISAKSLARLLADGLIGPDAQAWVETLPAVGIEGTVRNRMRNSVLEGRAWLKTGTLDDVRALAGYIRSAEGRWVVFVAMVNDPQAAKAKPAMDSLVKWAYTYH
jgi:D-alanyl-D-alanine carboxypeptidase/D-alanyl-D-alanine-endopeptidase (penicillin-binding protein 4)